MKIHLQTAHSLESLISMARLALYRGALSQFPTPVNSTHRSQYVKKSPKQRYPPKMCKVNPNQISCLSTSTSTSPPVSPKNSLVHRRQREVRILRCPLCFGWKGLRWGPGWNKRRLWRENKVGSRETLIYLGNALRKSEVWFRLGKVRLNKVGWRRREVTRKVSYSRGISAQESLSSVLAEGGSKWA